MSEHSLPEDLSQWPRDPYKLLGVEPGSSDREVRKAYTRLIRKYKPEHHPEHFRRIRDAYESIKEQIRYEEAFDAPFPEEADAGYQDLPLRPIDAESSGIEEEIDRLWDEARSTGELQRAYDRYVTLYATHSEHVDLATRLYWLLVIDPQLDSRVACDWLAEGLRKQNLTGPCRELYRREIEREPTEALTDRYSSLLNESVPAVNLTPLVEWRWLAAERLQRWEVIGTDIEFLRLRVEPEGEEGWIRLLLLAVEILACSTDAEAQELMRSCCREIEEADHVHSRLGEAMTRLDFVVEMSADWQKLVRTKQISNSLASLLAKISVRPIGELHPQMMAWLQEVQAQPQRWLREFDKFAQRTPTILGQIGHALELFHNYLPEPLSEARRAETLTALLLPFLESADWQSYQTFRFHLLRFCLREFLAPEVVADALTKIDRFADSELPQILHEDLALRLVCLASRLFWASA